MKYIKGIENYQSENRTAITLGKFDGLHLGHELLVNAVIKHQKQDNVSGVVFAFDMSSFFERRGMKYDRLLSNEEKAKRLRNRVDCFVECPFTDEIANMSAKDFIKKILVDKFHAKYIVIGTDFRFGHGRHGDSKLLQIYAAEYDYQVEIIEKKQYQGREISSTYVKEELSRGNLDTVNELLGYCYTDIYSK